MELNNKCVILEPSSNTHKINANNIIATTIDVGILQLEIEGDGIVTHGEHGTIKTESPYVVKYNQVELNPVTNMLQAAFD